MRLNFGEWKPDQPVLGYGDAEFYDAKNVFPAIHGYQPFKDITEYSTALTARCQGAFSLRDNSGTTATYAGDATKLYLLSSATFTDASRLVGGAYATPTDNQWRFAKWGNTVIAVNGADNPQSITVGTANFALLAGTPPVARHIGVVRDFVVMGNITGAQNRIQWSSSNNSTSWATGVNEANQQDIPDAGKVQAIIGGAVGYVFMERQIIRMTRSPSPVTFQIDVVESNRGALAPYSVVALGQNAIYLSQDGLYMFDGNQSVPLGAEKFDRTILSELNFSALDRVTAAIDPYNKVYLMAYPTGSSTTPNKLLIYKWDTQRASYAVLDIEILMQLFPLGVTLEGLDAYSASIETLTPSMDAAIWQGGQLTMGVFSSAHKLGFFTGSNLAATMTTQEVQPNPEGRAFISEMVPLIDTTQATVAVATRETQQATASYTPENNIASTGSIYTRASGRYFRTRVTTPAGASWTYCQGVDIPQAAIVSDGVR
jgi:hypothetical protein